MPRGPQGQRRPTDPARNALKILKIAIGEIDEDLQQSPEQLARVRAGGHARARKLTKTQRSAIARKAALARWHKTDTPTE